jgi:hypothetical protein
LSEVYLVQKPFGPFYKFCKFEVIQIYAYFVAKQNLNCFKIGKQKLFLLKKTGKAARDRFGPGQDAAHGPLTARTRNCTSLPLVRMLTGGAHLSDIFHLWTESGPSMGAPLTIDSESAPNPKPLAQAKPSI